MAKETLNGSTNLLAQAMREVFSEAMTTAVAPLQTEMKALRTDMRDMETRLNARIDTTNENMQAQFAEQERKIGQLLAKD